MRSGDRGTRVAEEDTPSPAWQFTLVVAGDTPLTTRVRQNVEALLTEHLDEDFEIETVDLRRNPERAENDRILAVPTLIRRHPLPQRRVLGDLTETDQVVAGLDLPRER